MPAIAGLAAVDLLLLALLAVLLYYSLRPIMVPFFAWLLGHIPVIGGQAAQIFERVVTDAENWVLARLTPVVEPLTIAITRVITRLLGFVLAVSAAVSATTAAIRSLYTVVIPALRRTLTDRIDRGVQAAVMEARALQESTLNTARALFALALASIAQAETRAAERAHAAGAAAEATARALASGVVDLAHRLHAQAIGHSDRAVAQETLRAHAEAQGVAVGAEATARRLSQEAERLARTLHLDGKAFSEALNARTLAAALAATGAVAVSVDAIRRLDCIKQCGPLGQLGRELEALELSGLLAMVAASAAAPKQTADLADALLGPIAQEGTDLARALLHL